MGFSLSHLDVSIIAGSVLLVVIVGLWVGRSADKSAKGYFLASGRMPWYIIGTAFVSTSVSSEQIVGTVGAAYKHGMGIANWEWWSVPTYALFLLFFVPLYLKNRITTVPEFLNRRFGPLCGDIYSWVMLFAYVVVFMASVLYGGSLAFSQLTGWSFGAVLWVTVILVGFYAVKGGLRSVMFTDAVQCLLLMAGGITLFFIALGKIPGGWHAMELAQPERFHLYHPPSDPVAPFPVLVLGSLGPFLFYQSSNQVMVQRVLSARSLWDGMMGVVFAGFINLFRPLVTCFLGFIVYHWINVMEEAPALANHDDSFAFVLRDFAPAWGLRGIILAGLVAAIMSTMSALANSTSTIFSLNVYQRFIDRKASEGTLILVGRAAFILSLVIAAILAPLVAQMGGIFTYFQTGVSYVATPFISVTILGIFWKRVSYRAAVAGLLGGTAIMVILGLGIPAIGYKVHWLYLAAVAEVLTMALTAAVTIALPGRTLDGNEDDTLLWSPSLLRTYEKEMPRPWWQSLKLWFGAYAVAWAYLYYRFW